MRVRWLVVLVLALSVSACSDPPDSRSVTEKSVSSSPFDGDLVDLGVWREESGRPVPTTKIVSFHGPEHCSWQDSTWIWLGEDGVDGEFIGNPPRDLRQGLRTTYELDIPVPADARDTGWSRNGDRLLIAADGSAAYLVASYEGADRTVGDRWPAPKKLGAIRCA